MAFNLEDRVRELERELQEMRSQLGRVQTRPAVHYDERWLGVCKADEGAVLPGGTVTVYRILEDSLDGTPSDPIVCTNRTGRIILPGSYVEVMNELILVTASPRFLSLAATQDAPTLYSHFQNPLDGGGSNPSFPFDGRMEVVTGVSDTTVTIADPNGLLPGVLTGDHVIFAVTANSGSETVLIKLVAIASKASGGSAIKIIRGQAVGAVAGGSFTIDNIVSMTPGYTHSTSPQAVSNPIGFSCVDNHVCFAILRGDGSAWDAWTDTDTTGGGGGTTYDSGFCIDETLFDSSDTIALIDTDYAGTDYEFFGAKDDVPKWFNPDNYDAAKEQVLSHATTTGQPLQWLDADIIQVDLI